MTRRSSFLNPFFAFFIILLTACGPARLGGSASAAPAPTASATAAGFQCADLIGCVDIAPGGSIHMAYLLVISGAAESLGIDTRNGSKSRSTMPAERS